MAVSSKAKAIELAGAQVKARNLEWVVGQGYDLNYKEICQKAEIKYGPAWRAIMGHYVPEGEKVVITGLSRTQLAALVAEMRHKENYSWGYIATCKLGVGAGLVYRLFEEATGLSAQGLRTGHGGRMAAKHVALYAGGDRKAKGSEIKSGVRAAEATPTEKRTLATRVAAAKKRK